MISPSMNNIDPELPGGGAPFKGVVVAFGRLLDDLQARVKMDRMSGENLIGSARIKPICLKMERSNPIHVMALQSQPRARWKILRSTAWLQP